MLLELQNWKFPDSVDRNQMRTMASEMYDPIAWLSLPPRHRAVTFLRNGETYRHAISSDYSLGREISEPETAESQQSEQFPMRL